MDLNEAAEFLDQLDDEIKIYYYGNPKKLRAELLKFGYQLNNDQGHWELYIDD